MKPMIILLLVIFTITIGGLIWLNNDMKPMDVIYTGALIAALGTVVAAYGTRLHNKSSSAKTDRIETGVKSTSEDVKKVQGQNEGLKVQIEQQAQTIDNLRKENTELSSKLSSESLKIYNSITGHGSFPEVQIRPQKGDSALIMVWNHGDSPLYDVVVTIVDIDLLRAHKGEHQLRNEYSISIDIGNIPPNSIVTPPTVLTANFKTRTKLFSIFTSARSGSFNEQYLLMKIDEVWRREVKVTDFSGKIVYLQYKEPIP